jgi:outer membrane protein TolC
MNKYFVLIGFFTLFFLNSPGQEVYLLDLQESIEIAKQHSHRMLILQQNLKIAEYNLKAATNSFKTNVDLRFIAPKYSENIVAQEDTSGILYYPQQQLLYSGDILIRQPLPTDGEITLSTGLLNIDDYYVENKSIKFNSEIRFSQPIEAFYAYNRLRSEFKKARLNYELSYKTLKRAELDLVYTISQSFYGLLSAKERKKIANQNLLRQQDAATTAQNKYAAGLIRETEALQMEIDLGEAQNNYDIATVDYESQGNLFKQQIGLSLQDSVEIEGRLDYEDVSVNIELAVQLGLENRLEIREHEIGIELTDIDIKRQKSYGLVRGEINAYYNFTGVGYNEIGTPMGDVFNDAWTDLNNRPANRGVELSVSIPIIDWGVNRSLVKAAQAGQESQRYSLDLEKVSIEREIRNTVNRLHSSLRRLQLLEKNVVLAEKNFEISNYRFTNGDIDAQTLALDRARLNNAYLSHLDAYISYKLLLADLARKTFYDFQNNKPYSYYDEL